MNKKNPSGLIMLLTAAVVMIAASSAPAQIVFGKKPSVGIRAAFYNWDLEDGGPKQSISQFSLPLTGFVPVRDNLEVLFSMAGLSTSYESSGLDRTVSGATDFQFQVNQSLAEDRVVLSMEFNIPSGKKELDYARDTTLVNLLSESYLAFPMRRYGRGFGASGLIGGAVMIGTVRAGVGLRLTYNGEYTPYKEIGKYDPGESISITVGLDRRSARNYVYADLIFSAYGSDTFDGQKTFKQSPMGALRAGIRQNVGQTRAEFATRLLLRGRNTEYAPDETVARQLQLYGDELSFHAGWRLPLIDTWAFTPLADAKFVFENEEQGDDRLGDSHVYGFGGQFSRKLTGDIELSVGGKYMTGTADNGAIDITGYQATLHLLTTF